MDKSGRTLLQVQIVAFGKDGIERVVKHSHPHIDGVKWLVSWQSTDPHIPIPKELSERDDFDIIIHYDKGVSRNRNYALDFPCESPYVLLSDDDVDYSKDSLLSLIKIFEDFPEADIVCCRYKCNGGYVKNYGDGVFSLDNTPFGWYPTTFEMAFRRKSLNGIRFNENIGPGSGKLIAGEDSIWYCDMIKHGAKGIGYPLDICEHNQSTTGERLITDPDFLKSYGACMVHIKPLTWFPRLILHAHRTSMPFFKCLYHTLSGVKYSFTHHIFK